MCDLITWVLLGFIVFPACVPAYIMASKVAISAILGVASGLSSEVGTEESEVPKEKSEVYEMYINCLKQRGNNPKVDCSRYRIALEAHTE